MNKLLRLAALTTVSLAALSANAAGTVVWDQGPATGTQSGLWSNQTGGQTIADSVSFAAATEVSGYNYFSGFDLSADTSSTAFHLVVMADNGGLPGTVVYSADIGYDSYANVGGVNEMHFDFAPLQFAAGQTYWIGLSGNGFEAALPTVSSPQDGSIAYNQGGPWALAAIGDQMFQLTATSAVPETGNVALMGAGLALLGLAARRRQRN